MTAADDDDDDDEVALPVGTGCLNYIKNRFYSLYSQE